jgi:membrane peptidoglycan carboxypeptidase
VVLLVGGTAGWLATPSVSDAGRRVAALAARDGAGHLHAGVPHDARFYGEPGIDPVGIARAAWVTLHGGGTDPGGSTLSQQLAKQLYTGGRSNVGADLEQVALAVKLNLAYSKADILRMYADTVYFGNGFYGLHNAACGYFARTPSALTLAQASVLAGLVQAPSAYDPLHHLALARARQRYVLARLVATGTITAARASQVARAPLHLAPGASCGG